MLTKVNRTNTLNKEYVTVWVELHSTKTDPEKPFPTPSSTDQVTFRTRFVDDKIIERECYRQGYWPEDWNIVQWDIISEEENS